MFKDCVSWCSHMDCLSEDSDTRSSLAKFLKLPLFSFQLEGKTPGKMWKPWLRTARKTTQYGPLSSQNTMRLQADRQKGQHFVSSQRCFMEQYKDLLLEFYAFGGFYLKLVMTIWTCKKIQQQFSTALNSKFYYHWWCLIVSKTGAVFI